MAAATTAAVLVYWCTILHCLYDVPIFAEKDDTPHAKMCTSYTILYFIVYIVSCGRCGGDDIMVWYMRRVLGYVSNPSARLAAASAAPGGCCSLFIILSAK